MLRVIGRREADSLVRSDDLIGLEGSGDLGDGCRTTRVCGVNVRGSLMRRPALSCQGQLACATPSVVVVGQRRHTLRVEALQPPRLMVDLI